MRLLYSQKINKDLKEDFFYSFETNEGIYFVEVIAQAKSWWQNFKSLRSLFKDDDIALSLDNIEIFTSYSRDSDVRAIWNGNELKGFSQTVLIAASLKPGGHTLRFQPDQSPSLESVNIFELEDLDNNTIVYSPTNNNPPTKGDRRPWLKFILQNLAIKEISIAASANKQGRDDEDIKLIIDGKVAENTNKNAHKDWYWCGKILQGEEAVFQSQTGLEMGKHSIELLSDGSPSLKKIKVLVLSDSGNVYKEKPVRPYHYQGISGDEDYNRYDATIADVVAYWNSEFLKDTNPPSEPLDPNLIKAMIYQESRVGYYKGEKINIMQVGNVGDPSLKTLRGEFKEYWIHNGEKILLKYDAKVVSAKDSIYWGVRWLYHKAQGVTYENKRYWNTWKAAVVGYGPKKAYYAPSVWDIYKKGIKKEKNGNIRLWSIILFMLMSLIFFDSSSASSLKMQIVNDAHIMYPREPLEDVEISYSSVDKNYFLAQIEWEKDWWEDLKVGKIKDKSMAWFIIDKLPSEQAIFSAKFIDLKGFSNPLIEVYGLTHQGHGFLYIYEIKNDAIDLLFKTEAIVVDGNPDCRWVPDNYKKYGYGYCGEKFLGDKLTSEYKDLNKDGVTDLTLSGTQEIICEKDYEKIKRNEEVNVDSIKIERKFLWNREKHTWVGI